MLINTMFEMLLSIDILITKSTNAIEWWIIVFYWSIVSIHIIHMSFLYFIICMFFNILLSNISIAVVVWIDKDMFYLNKSLNTERSITDMSLV